MRYYSFMCCACYCNPVLILICVGAFLSVLYIYTCMLFEKQQQQQKPKQKNEQKNEKFKVYLCRLWLCASAPPPPLQNAFVSCKLKIK